MIKNFLLLLFFISIPCVSIHALDEYVVQFDGVTKKETISLLKSVSQLIALEHSPPATAAGIYGRVHDDTSKFIQALQSLGYYEPQIEENIDFNEKPILIQFKIDTGPLYLLTSFQIEFEDPSILNCGSIPLSDLGITLYSPALPKDILEAEEKLLLLMARKGYPLAQIKEREAIADQQAKTISVILYVKEGPLAHFGPTTISGQRRVKDAFFEKKIAWEEGKIFAPKKIEKTQNALEASGLFTTIAIVPAKEAPDGVLPIEIQVVEAKHRSIEAGISYSTELGAGVLAGWQHRNFRGLGEKLSLQSNITQVLQEGTFSYIKPDFLRKGQDLLWIAEAQHEETKGYTDSSFSVAGIIERQVHHQTRMSIGGKVEYLHDTHSDNNRQFILLKIPAQIRWSNANSLLDPTEGQSAHLKIVPAMQTLSPTFGYCTTTFIGAAYFPLTKDNRFVFATKVNFGMILGATSRTIPPSERFYAGSDSTLRGYHYLTVSPLNRHHDPIGGRSMLIYNFEARLRTSEKLGWVVFYDIGNVFFNFYPRLGHRLLQSTGLGFRYYTPVGPLRLDIAFPLNRRPQLDSAFQIYVSIGQSF